MEPVFSIGTHNYTHYLAAEGLKPTRNDLDADGSGRNLLDGLMYRNKITDKQKWTVTFNRLDEEMMAQLEQDMNSEYVDITMLDFKTNRQMTRTYYCSTMTPGVQRYIGGKTVYDGVTFNITER